MRVCHFILAFLFVSILSSGSIAAPSSSAPATGKIPQLQCMTVPAPDPDKGKAPTKTCDDVCGASNTVCVSNGDITNPRNCETPTIATCRCCSIIETK
jgi:hypothetical protein